jgi:hypothetical protein
MMPRPTPEVLPGGSTSEPWDRGAADALEIDYEAGGAHATLDGSGRVAVRVDGGEQGAIEVAHPGLYDLASHPRHESHRLELRVSNGVRVWSVAFSPGIS